MRWQTCGRPRTLSLYFIYSGSTAAPRSHLYKAAYVPELPGGPCRCKIYLISHHFLPQRLSLPSIGLPADVPGSHLDLVRRSMNTPWAGSTLLLLVIYQNFRFNLHFSLATRTGLWWHSSFSSSCEVWVRRLQNHPISLCPLVASGIDYLHLKSQKKKNPSNNKVNAQSKCHSKNHMHVP